MYSNPLPTAEPARAGCPRLCPIGFWESPKMETPQPLRATSFQCLTMHTVKTLFVMFRWNFMYFNLCPLSLVLSLCSSEETPALSSLFPLSKYLYTLIKLTPEPSLLEEKKSQFPQSLIGCFNPLTILVAVCWIHSRISMSLETQNCTQYSRCGLSNE